MKKPLGYIFDMDGLMFDSERIYLKANKIAGQAMGITITDEDYHALTGSSNDAIGDYFGKRLGSAELVQEFIERTRLAVISTIQTQGLPIKPGLIELLAMIDETGAKKIIASSNNRAMVDFFLASTQLMSRFDQFVTFDDVQAGKPAPDIFLCAQQKLALPSDECLILEDSINGVNAADAAQIPVAMVPDLILPTQQISDKCVGVFDDLNSVRELLESLN